MYKDINKSTQFSVSTKIIKENYEVLISIEVRTITLGIN